MRSEYLSAYPACQYTQAMGRYVQWRKYGALCIEHIWNRRGKGSEHWSNYATVCPEAHLWKHSNSVEARLGILWFKSELREKTGDERHFDLEVLKLASGFHIPGWIERKIDGDIPDWAKRLGQETLTRIERLCWF